MAKLRLFLSRHVIWVILMAVTMPLMIILAVQYRSLSQLEKTLPIANKTWMKKYLVTVASQVEDTYRANAEQTLSVPADAFARGMKFLRWGDVISHFENNRTKGIKRLFVGTTGEEKGRGYSIVFFYDPASEHKFVREPGSQQWRAAHGASALWLYHSITNSIPGTTMITVDERDKQNRIIVKPIVDRESRVVGVAGMIADQEYLKEILPGVIQSSLSRFFPSDHQDVVVALNDDCGNLVFSTQQIEGKNYEVSEPLHFIFKDWNLKIQMRNMTEEQGAKRVFAVNLSLSVLMMGLVIGGIIMALRTASREMRVSQMKADFVSNVSHELRTPLASIRVFGEFLRLGRVKEPQKIREYGEYIETESRRLTQLINNILDFSRIESGGKTYRFEEANISEIIAQTLKAFEVRLNQSGFSIVFETTDRPLPAVVDSDAIAQAFVNLLDNAVKYSGSSKEIIVRVGRKDEYITVSVTDHGIGISREEREKIFEKFYRVSTGLVHDVKGSGLGLSIVKHIVVAHRGIVTVESKPGDGSTFTIFLPVGPTTGDRPQTREGQREPGARLEMGVDFGD